MSGIMHICTQLVHTVDYSHYVKGDVMAKPIQEKPGSIPPIIALPVIIAIAACVAFAMPTGLGIVLAAAVFLICAVVAMLFFKAAE